jgi:hypothetical protein
MANGTKTAQNIIHQKYYYICSLGDDACRDSNDIVPGEAAAHVRGGFYRRSCFRSLQPLVR